MYACSCSIESWGNVFSHHRPSLQKLIGKKGGRNNGRNDWLEMFKLRICSEGRDTTWGVSFLQREMRICQCDMLHTGLWPIGYRPKVVMQFKMDLVKEPLKLKNVLNKGNGHIARIMDGRSVKNWNREIRIMDKYVCTICGYVYDPKEGDPDGGIDPGTKFEDIPGDWVCPVCGAAKDQFEKEWY